MFGGTSVGGKCSTQCIFYFEKNRGKIKRNEHENSQKIIPHVVKQKQFHPTPLETLKVYCFTFVSSFVYIIIYNNNNFHFVSVYKVLTIYNITPTLAQEFYTKSLASPLLDSKTIRIQLMINDFPSPLSLLSLHFGIRAFRSKCWE